MKTTTMQSKASILSTLLNKKGQFGRATWERPCKTRKTSNIGEIVKRTSLSIRAGIDYNNLSNVQDKRENGELPETPQPLPWGQWQVFPYTVIHNDTTYLRLYPHNGAKPETEYLLNGNPVKLDEIKEHLLASELPKSGEKPDCITVKLDNMLELV